MRNLPLCLTIVSLLTTFLPAQVLGESPEKLWVIVSLRTPNGPMAKVALENVVRVDQTPDECQRDIPMRADYLMMKVHASDPMTLRGSRFLAARCVMSTGDPLRAKYVQWIDNNKEWLLDLLLNKRQ